MIDSMTARALRELQVRKAELLEAYTPGFQPVDDDERAAQDRARPSLNPLSSVAPEGAYFVAQDSYGRSFYSRNGDFSIVDGQLRTPNGSAVLGYGPNGGGVLAPIKLDSVDVALRRVENVMIDQAGHVSYVRRVVDPVSSAAHEERVIVGTIALARFPEGTNLTAADGVHVTAPAGVSATLGTAELAGFGALRVGWGDHGAVDVKASLRAVNEAYIQYDALRSAESARGSTDKTVMDLIK